MNVVLKGMIVDIYVSEKSNKCYTSIVDLDNGQKVVLVTNGIYDVNKGEFVVYEGDLFQLRYGYSAKGVLRRIDPSLLSEKNKD